MALDIACPSCGERRELSGETSDEGVRLTCGSCGEGWDRTLSASCDRCGGDDLQTVPLAIVERSRGTQLSIVGTRPVALCSVCDADALERYHAHRPNPLMPTELPTMGEERGRG